MGSLKRDIDGIFMFPGFPSHSIVHASSSQNFQHWGSAVDLHLQTVSADGEVVRFCNPGVLYCLTDLESI